MDLQAKSENKKIENHMQICLSRKCLGVRNLIGLLVGWKKTAVSLMDGAVFDFMWITH